MSFKKHLIKYYPGANTNDQKAVILMLRAGEEFAKMEKIELLRSLKKELEDNDNYFDVIDDRIEEMLTTTQAGYTL